MANTKWASLYHKYKTKCSYYFSTLAFTENTEMKIQLLSGFVLKQLSLYGTSFYCSCF